MKPFALSIAGLDPSGGAGLLADIKTFEANGVTGLGICSALTFQNDSCFQGLEWISPDVMIRQLEPLFEKFSIRHVKIGLIENLESLQEILQFLFSKNRSVQIVWDPILKATAGYVFHTDLRKEKIINLCSMLALITPNLEEIKQIMSTTDEQKAARQLGKKCAVLLKGGHSENKLATDRLFIGEKVVEFSAPKTKHEKHGTGCILSGAIVSYLARGYDLESSCQMAKRYITGYLNSSKQLLGHHYFNNSPSII